MAPEHARVIARETVVARPWLCPEIQLHLVNESCRLWRATEGELEALGLPDPFWAFAWAGGQALARYLLDHPSEVHGLRVFDFGAGGGIEAIAAAMSKAARVVVNDIDPFALEAAQMNAVLNGVTIEASGADHRGLELRGFDLILAGDVFYGSDGDRTLRWLAAVAASGPRVLLAEPARGFIDTRPLVRLAEYDAPADVDTNGRHLRRTGVYTLSCPALPCAGPGPSE